MNGNFYVALFGTFGNPHGFTQSFFITKTDAVAKSIGTFDIKTNAITLFPNSSLFGISKHRIDNKILISFTMYSYAKEKGSDRGGTFLGSTIIFENVTPEFEHIIKCLKQIHQDSIANNTTDSVLNCSQSKELIFTKFKELDKLNVAKIKVGTLQNFPSDFPCLLHYSSLSDQTLVERIQDALLLLNTYQTVYFSDSQEIFKYVHSKHLYDTSQNEASFKTKVEETRLKIQRQKDESLQFLDAEKKALQEDLNRVLAEIQDMELINEQISQKNKEKTAAIAQFKNLLVSDYKNYETKIEEAIYHVNNNEIFEAVLKFHKNNERNFIESRNSGNRPTYLAEFKNFVPKPISARPTPIEAEDIAPKREKKGQKKKPIKLFRWLSLFFCIATLGFAYMYFNSLELFKENTQELNTKEIQIKDLQQSLNDKDSEITNLKLKLDSVIKN